MEFRVYFKHMDSSLALYAYAEKKLGERIAKYVKDPIEALVTFSRGADAQRHSVSCQLLAGPQFSLTVEHSDRETLYASVDILAVKLDRRLRQQKEKLRSHRARRGVELFRVPPAPQEPAPEGDTIDAAEIIRFEPARKRLLEQRLQ